MLDRSIFIALVIFLAMPSLLKADQIYPLQEYEIVAVESHPESLTLNMNLHEIVEAKLSSRMAISRKKVYDQIVLVLEPVLRAKAKADKENLVDFVNLIPVKKILTNLVNNTRGGVNPMTAKHPADFTILILPKVPHGNADESSFSYSKFYSASKAPLIDTVFDSNFKALGYKQKIDRRFERGLQFLFRRQYIERENTPFAFFVGALLRIRLKGEQSSAKLQVLTGLPIGQSYSLGLEKGPLFIDSIFSPKSPTLVSLQRGDYPGAILALDYQHGELDVESSQRAQLNLKVSFGNFGLLQDMNWTNSDPLKKDPGIFEIAKWWGTESYNVPFVLGLFSKDGPRRKIKIPMDPNQPTEDFAKKTADEAIDKPSFLDKAIKLVTGSLDRHFTWRANIHEIVFDMVSMEVKDVRLTVGLQGGMPLPLMELSVLNTTIRDGANERIQPFREELVSVLQDTNFATMTPERAVVLGQKIKQIFLKEDLGGLQ